MTTLPPLAQRLQVLRDLLPLADGFDRSWSVASEGPVEERFLLFLPNRPGRLDALAQAAAGLGMDAAAIKAWRAATQGADALGLGANTGLTSVRLYAQHWDQMVQRVDSGQLDPAPLYRGFKLLPGGTLREDAYICHPRLARDAFWPLMKDGLSWLGLPETALEASFAGLGAEEAIVCEINSPARASWLVTVRKARLDRGAWRDCLEALPAQPWADDLRAQSRSQPLLHVAGGEDSEKGLFVTLYFEATEAQIASVLDRIGSA